MLVFPQKLLTEHCTFRCQPAYTYLCPSHGRPSACNSCFQRAGADQTVKKDHQPAGTDPSGERAIATENTWMAMADPERASSGAEKASCCGGPVSESTQSACQLDGATTSFQKHTDRAHVSGTEWKLSKSTQSACQLDGATNSFQKHRDRARVSWTERQLPHQLCDGIETHFEGLGCGLIDKSAHLACTRHWV